MRRHLQKQCRDGIASFIYKYIHLMRGNTTIKPMCMRQSTITLVEKKVPKVEFINALLSKTFSLTVQAKYSVFLKKAVQKFIIPLSQIYRVDRSKVHYCTYLQFTNIISLSKQYNKLIESIATHYQSQCKRTDAHTHKPSK